PAGCSRCATSPWRRSAPQSPAWRSTCCAAPRCAAGGPTPGPAARAQVTEVAHRIEDGADDPRYATVLALADPVLQGQEVTEILDRVVLETVADPATLWLLGMAAHTLVDPVSLADFLSLAETNLRQHGRLGLLSQVLNME